MENAELLNEFFAVVFTASQATHASHTDELLSGGQGAKYI